MGGRNVSAFLARLSTGRFPPHPDLRQRRFQGPLRVRCSHAADRLFLVPGTRCRPQMISLHSNFFLLARAEKTAQAVPRRFASA